MTVSMNISQIPIRTDPQIVRSETRSRMDNIGIGFQTDSGMHNEAHASNTTI
jgi:hypothetical protein